VLEGIQMNWIIEVCSYILATQPGGQGIVAMQKIKKKKSAFKTASDGRLIITEDSSGSEEEEYANDLDSGKFNSVKRITTTPYSETFLMQDI
jgi:hypothetical protein